MKEERRSSLEEITDDTMRFLGGCAKFIEKTVYPRAQKSRQPQKPCSSQMPCSSEKPCPPQALPCVEQEASTPVNDAPLTISEREECLRAKVYIRDFTSKSKQVRLLALNQIKKLSKPIAKTILKKLLFQENEQVKQIEVLGALATCNGRIDGLKSPLKN